MKKILFVLVLFVISNTINAQSTKDQLVAEAGMVTSGVLEIAKKQQEGWSYIKMVINKVNMLQSNFVLNFHF